MIISHPTLIQSNLQTICDRKVSQQLLSPKDAEMLLSKAYEAFTDKTKTASESVGANYYTTIIKLAEFFGVCPSEIDPTL